MRSKTFAIITDVHSNSSALMTALDIINNRDDIDQTICLGDYFALGPDPKGTFKMLNSISNPIYIRGNHERYLMEEIWKQENPDLEGMSGDDPILKEILANEEWTANELGNSGALFCEKTHISYRQIIGNTLVEFSHAWFERDEIPPTIDEGLKWRDDISIIHPEITQYIFVHGHLHIPREESKENLKILCQGATGLPFDENPKGAIAFLTVGKSFKWDVVRFEYDSDSTINLLENRKPPFYKNLQNTVRYASIRNDI